ncbi:MAG: hypothetical protein PVJ86_09215, partial [Phycisphaerales bacterium]
FSTKTGSAEQWVGTFAAQYDRENRSGPHLLCSRPASFFKPKPAIYESCEVPHIHHAVAADRCNVGRGRAWLRGLRAGRRVTLPVRWPAQVSIALERKQRITTFWWALAAPPS